MPIIQCPHCSGLVYDQDHFCRHCGANLLSTIKPIEPEPEWRPDSMTDE